MSRLTLHLPETLHRHLESLARREQVSLNQYIVYALTQQSTLAYTIQAATEDDIIQQQADFDQLLDNLGRTSASEIEQALNERNHVEAETDLNPEAVQRLCVRIAKEISEKNHAAKS